MSPTCSSSRPSFTTSPRSPPRPGGSARSRSSTATRRSGRFRSTSEALGIDAYIGGCLKWLCGGPGAAFLWVDPDARRRLAPKLTGWMAHQQPFRVRAEARRRDGCLAVPARHAQHPGPLRRPGLAGDRQPDRGRCDPRKSRCGRPTACSTWPIATDFAARPATACAAGRHRRGRLDNGHEIRTQLEVARHPLRLPPRRGHPTLTPLLQSRRRAGPAIEAMVEIRTTGAWRAFTTTQPAVT